jgi:hypothetical protein
MSVVPPDFQQVIELASQLSPEDQLRLVVRIGENLTTVFSGKEANEAPPGSATAILRAIREPPRLSDDDVNELERAIIAGRLPMRAEGVFDRTDDA